MDIRSSQTLMTFHGSISPAIGQGDVFTGACEKVVHNPAWWRAHPYQTILANYVWGRRAAIGLFLAVLGALMLFSLPSFSQSAETPIPENAHARSYGKGWECDQSYRAQGDVCVAIIVPDNAYPTNRSYGSGWECQHGYNEVNGAECAKVVVPDGGFLDPSGERWQCLRGYLKTYEGCQKITLPDNAYLSDDSSGSEWRCDRGFEVKGDVCVAIQVPEHGFLNTANYGPAWLCERGFRSQGGKCNEVNVPENAYFDDTAYGPGWACNRGYAVSGDRCVVIDLPENAHLDRSGNRWDCHRNYRESNGLCVSNN